MRDNSNVSFAQEYFSQKHLLNITQKHIIILQCRPLNVQFVNRYYQQSLFWSAKYRLCMKIPLLNVKSVVKSCQGKTITIDILEKPIQSSTSWTCIMLLQRSSRSSSVTIVKKSSIEMKRWRDMWKLSWWWCLWEWRIQMQVLHENIQQKL